MKEYFSEYFEAIKSKRGTEMTFRTPLENLLNAIKGDDHIKVTHEPKRETGFGAPDFKIEKSSSIIGYIETKDLDADLDKIRKTEQIKRYLNITDNLVITNYREFILIKKGKITERITLFYDTDLEKKRSKLKAEKIDKLNRLFNDFFRTIPERIGRIKLLAIALAERGKILKEFITEALKSESYERYPTKLKGLYQGYQKTLIEDIKETEFADAFTQTLIYGLILAKLEKKCDIARKIAFDYIPKSFPVLRELFDFFSREDPPSHMKWIFEEIISVVNHMDERGIADELKFYGGEHSDDTFDPYYYFYEPFLKEFDAIQKKEKGVYYTPIPVVNFIVRSLNNILKNKFKKQDGFSSSDVTVLDFACGTGTFLAEIFKLILKGMKRRGDMGQINKAISDHLLKDFYGFEYLVAPYAVAHLKLSQLIKELGDNYDLKDKERLQIYLTDTLDNTKHMPDNMFYAMSMEGKRANEIKDKEKILVITGNPPYNIGSKNKSKWITEIIKDYKPEGEKKLNIDDDYIKFIRFAHYKMSQIDKGVIGIITNNSFINGITHRKMRAELLNEFDEIYILNLHGNARTGETAPDGGKDENVFDIMQGVCISFFVKSPHPTSHSSITDKESPHQTSLSSISDKESPHPISHCSITEKESPHPKSLSSITEEESPYPTSLNSITDKESPHPKSFSQGEKDFLGGKKGTETGQYNYPPKYVIELARQLRKSDNKPEEIIWELLRDRKFLGYKFRRQHPIDKYIADFYCNELRLVIEVDGSVHNEDYQREYDKNRDGFLHAMGYNILRIKAKDIFNNLKSVLNEIIHQLPSPPGRGTEGEGILPSPSGRGTEGEGMLPSPPGRGTEGEGSSSECRVFYYDLWGKRSDKFKALREKDIDKIDWQELDFAAFDESFKRTRWGKRFPYFKFFVPMEDVKIVKEYGNAWGMKEIFKVLGSGVKTDRDEIVIDFNENSLSKRLIKAFSGDYDENFKKRYKIHNSSSYDFADKLIKQDFETEKIRPVHYRPFDFRKIYYKVGFTSRPAYKVMCHFLAGENVGLVFPRIAKENKFNYGLAVNSLIDVALGGKNTGSETYVAPLYLYEETDKGLFGSPHPKSFSHREKDSNLPSPFGRGTEGEGNYPLTDSEGKKPNFTEEFTKFIKAKYGAEIVDRETLRRKQTRTTSINKESKDEEESKSPFISKISKGQLDYISPEEIFGYIYAMLYCPTYREKYLELLKIDFPRVPFNDDIEKFKELSTLGWELAQHHLMKETYDFISNYPIPREEDENLVEFVKPSSVLRTPSPSGRRTKLPSPLGRGTEGEGILPSPPGRGTEGEGILPSPPGRGTEGEGFIRVWINNDQYFDNIPREVWDFYIGGYQVLKTWLTYRKRANRTLSNTEINTFKQIVNILDFTIKQMEKIDKVAKDWV